ncbi:hypothetical protein DL95DRAFT_511563 [Leptodontidium sp. 2 PMI_412]|nr:hypothetical protein DL95DRAFT_511563 [Leptodontidium sp. 2 PMI_412]
MDPTDHQGAGDHENISWMSTGFYLPGPGDESFMQPENGDWNLGSYVNLNDLFPSVMMNEPAAGRDWTAQAPSNHINNLTANGVDPRSYTPRYIPPFPVSDSNIELQNPPNMILPEGGEEETEYTHVEIPHVRNSVRTNSALSSEEWERRKPELEILYFQPGSTLEDTRAKMAKRGFYAGATSYKRRIKEWGWETYECDKESGDSSGKPSTAKPAKRIRGKATGHPTRSRDENSQPKTSQSTPLVTSTPPQPVHTNFQPTHSNRTHFPSSCPYPTQFTSTHFNPSAVYEKIPQANSSGCTTVAAFTPPCPPSTPINPTHASMGIPPPIRDTDFNELMNTILNNVKDLYISYPAQKKWKVQKHREVEEDIHDDLLVGVATNLKNSRSLSRGIGNKGFQNVLQMVEGVVGVGEGSDCGLFSLPVIWISFLRLVREKRPAWARQFLSLALKLARQKFGPKHQFVQVLSGLQKIWRKDPDQITEVVLAAYGRCIEDVKKSLGAFHLTYLSLWGDFVVYLDGRSVHDTQALVEDIRSVIKIVEEEKGPDGGPNSDYALELLGLTLYVLQSAPSSPTMADQAEKVAEELHRRLEERKAEDGGQLEGNLFTTWKDLRQLLGKFCQDKENYHHAIGYLEEFLRFEIEDERDACALENLERFYKAVGRNDAAKDVRQRWVEISEVLLRKTKKDPAEGEKGADDHEETHEEDGGDVDGAEGSSEATVVNQAEERSKENPEEDIANEYGDSGVEIQLLEEQIAGLQQRVKDLKRERGSEETL